MSGVTLRSYCFLDNLQPQLSAQMCTGARGYFQVPGVACLYMEIAPGMAIHSLIDTALKSTAVQPGTIIVERAYGMLEIHHEDQGEVLHAGAAMLEQLGMKENDRVKPRVASNTVIRSIEPMHAMIIDRIRFGSMITPDQSMLIMEASPAAYIAIAANEAEKAANVTLVDFKPYGAFGRLYMAGSEADVDVAAQAATAALEGIDGVEEKKR